MVKLEHITDSRHPGYLQLLSNSSGKILRVIICGKRHHMSPHVWFIMKNLSEKYERVHCVSLTSFLQIQNIKEESFRSRDVRETEGF